MDKNFLKYINVLYVEDESDVRELTANILSKFLNNVIQAQNGKEGLELFEKHNNTENSEFTIDLIVTDINMPKMNGLEMIREIHKLDYTIPAVITTAHSDADFLKEAIHLRVRGYVTKPLKINDLIDTIRIAAEPKYLKDKLEVLNKQLSFEVEEKTLELRSILDSQENMILVFNEYKVSSANKTFLEFFKLDKIDDFIANNKPINSFFIDEQEYFYTKEDDWISEIMKLEDMKRVVCIKNGSNEEKIFKVDIKTFFYETKHYVVSFTDITELQEYTYELQYQATHDSLTKLYNRQKLNEELTKEILRENRYQHNLSILMLDIDDFKNVNDTYGHDVGDIVLIDLSTILKNCIRVTDYAARWGGEEFMVLLPETSIDETTRIADDLRVKIEEYQPDNIDLPITISIGIAEFVANENTRDDFIKNVDIALYQAKRTGKNKVVKYEKQ
jgi:diguanylate cyclase (GGDEF)-like protein